MVEEQLFGTNPQQHVIWNGRRFEFTEVIPSKSGMSLLVNLDKLQSLMARNASSFSSVSGNRRFNLPAAFKMDMTFLKILPNLSHKMDIFDSKCLLFMNH